MNDVTLEEHSLRTAAKAEYCRESLDTFQALYLLVSDETVGEHGIVFEHESDELGPYRIARYKFKGVAVFFHSSLLFGTGFLNVCVDLNGCVREGLKPIRLARDFVKQLRIEAKEDWVDEQLDALYAKRLPRLQQREQVKAVVRRRSFVDRRAAKPDSAPKKNRELVAYLAREFELRAGRGLLAASSRKQTASAKRAAKKP
jgi:hypothetical protein